MRNLTLATTLVCAAALPLSAEVNIYSARQPELIQPMLDAFTAETGIDVNIVFLQDGMIERLKAEGARSPADVVLTVDIASLTAIAEAGVTQPVVSDLINANIPAQFRDPEGNWIGLTSRARVAYVSNERVAAGEITTFEDLADPRWQGRICTRSGLHSYNVAMVAAFLAHNGEEATLAWLEGLKANLARSPQGNDRAQVKAIWAGECDVALGNTYYMGKMLEDPEQTEWANSTNIVFPIMGGSGAHVNVSGMAMTASAPNRDDALALMEFLTSQTAQSLYAEVNYEYPLNPAVSPSELVQSWGSFTPDAISLTEVAAKRADAVRLIEQVNFDE
ncbi:Fe(3+) ABC transporter substrate-binding protein [Abyssibius alkaniclasticus]|uniref:Fe(3+) ABC transporter substrate-binding protein n=1 Tax=Abyssibius alkaniclasticus TaxID=2881234 RepID=UPI0023641042|nr:Fe(3+) ABC transporter substrate-binding protein [Abyssibius alkaniclasticus]UPH70783.1 Fe(3+) ABC transporter substrate-binding protein [Abyssibius alkaniclasticus]